jgi:iron complex transport system substrate-binding protein
MKKVPQKIICLTEESVEFLFDIGRSDLIAGVSVYVERPIEAKALSKIGAFTHANIKKIVEMKPDLVIGFSDIQKDIARDLIGAGLNVFISNQRSIEEIFEYLSWFGNLIGEVDKTEKYLNGFRKKIIETKERVQKNKYRPRVYIEEWDEPTIIGIKWFTELVELCGGDVVFRDLSLTTSLAMDRVINSNQVVDANPEIILVSWCGKKFDKVSFLNREGYETIEAVKENNIYELDPAIFLQPGPALFKEGIDILIRLFDE